MGTSDKRTFYCLCCDRTLPVERISQAALINRNDDREPVCRQCASFLTQNLFHLEERIAAAGKRWEKVATRPVLPISRPPSVSATTKANATPPKKPKRPAPAAKKPRSASTLEREAFALRCVAQERFIEGFILGLEIAGIDRKKMSDEAIRAVDTLLRICQKTRSERLKANSSKASRTEIRKLTRHLRDTSLMVEEYVNAVKESFKRASQSAPPLRRQRTHDSY